MTTSTPERSGTSAPRLSVVIASSNDGTLLNRCVEALVTQADPDQVEIIVARDAGRFADVDRAGRRDHTHKIQWIEAPIGSTVPALRGLGIAAANAELIALLEDDCVVATGWCRTAGAFAGREAAVGGAVEPGPYRSALDWAVYFCEYGRFMLPVSDGAAAPLPGNNVVYARWALTGLPESARAEFHEAFVHTGWQVTGVPTSVDGSLVVHNVNSWSVRHVTSVPFHHGRAYAARRFGSRGTAVRGAVAILTLTMPVVKILRIIRGTVGRGRLVRQLATALPWMLLFLGSWSAGEIVGCLAGPGNSPSRWR